jgi:hypothetical protein
MIKQAGSKERVTKRVKINIKIVFTQGSTQWGYHDSSVKEGSHMTGRQQATTRLGAGTGKQGSANAMVGNP